MYTSTSQVAQRGVVATSDAHERRGDAHQNRRQHLSSGDNWKRARIQETTMGRRHRPFSSAATHSSFASYLSALPEGSDRVLLASVLKASIADSTYKAYERQLLSFTRFCHQRGYTSVPATIEAISAFLVFSYRTNSLNGAALRQLSAALRKTHMWRGYPPPQDNPVVAHLFKGYQRLTQSKINALKRTPLLVSQALMIANNAALCMARLDLQAARDAALILYQFLTFARASTAAAQRTKHVNIGSSTMSFRLDHEKNWHVRRSIVLQKTMREPVAVHPWDVLRQWALQVRSQRWKYLFSPKRPLRYVEISMAWKRALAAAGIIVTDGSLLPHSARAGGASAAAAMGVPTVVIAQRGGWRSLNSVISYTYPITRDKGDTLFFGDLQPTAGPV